MFSRKQFIGSIVLLFCVFNSAVALEATVNNNAIVYEESGTGEVVLFVHGAISDRRAWSPYQELVEKKRRFVSYDQRYFGESIPQSEDAVFSADAHASDLNSFIEALDAGPVAVVAWSYGGDVAARAAIARPDLFRALVYYEPDINGLISNLPGADRATQTIYQHYNTAIEAVEQGRLEVAALAFIDAVFMLPAGGASKEPAFFKRMWQENGRTLPQMLTAPAGNVATCDDLRQVNVPTLVVLGGHGHTYDAMMAEQAAQCHPQAILAMLEGVNHDGPYRKPKEFYSLIDRFLGLVR